MADTTTPNANSASTSGAPFAGLIQLAGVAEQGFATYETASAAKKAIGGLNTTDLMYVLLGLGGLAVVAIFVLKH